VLLLFFSDSHCQLSLIESHEYLLQTPSLWQEHVHPAIVLPGQPQSADFLQPPGTHCLPLLNILDVVDPLRPLNSMYNLNSLVLLSHFVLSWLPLLMALDYKLQSFISSLASNLQFYEDASRSISSSPCGPSHPLVNNP
jgi:hypothetical protein